MRRGGFWALAAGLGLAATAVLPMSRSDRWWIRALDFPRLQLLALYVAAAPLVLRAAGASRAGRLAAGALVAAAVYQAAWVWPYLPGAPVEVGAASRHDRTRAVRLLVANVRQGNRRVDRLLDLVAAVEPDVVVLDEADDWWVGRLHRLRATFPHATTCPLDNAYGMALYSKLPVDESKVRFLVEPDVPSIHARARLRSGEAVRVISLHPRPPQPASDTGERDAELVLVGREAAATPGPTIVCGDMNDVAWSATSRLFQKVSGLLDPRRGRGLYATFHARTPRWLRYPLDHLFHSGHFRLVQMRTLGDIGSDHLPLLVELAYEPGAAAEQPGPRPAAEDLERAREEVEPVRGARQA